MNKIKNATEFLEKYDDKDNIIVFDLDDTLVYLGESVFPIENIPKEKVDDENERVFTLEYKGFPYDLARRKIPKKTFTYQKNFLLKDKIPYKIYMSIKNAHYIILTARLKKFKQYLYRNLWETKLVENNCYENVIMTGTKNKLKVLKSYLKRNQNLNPKKIIMIDDSIFNIRDFCEKFSDEYYEKFGY